MELRNFWIIALFGIISFPSFSDPVNQSAVSKAQTDMIKRENDAATNYAKKISIDQMYVIYCTQEAYLQTYQHPKNGFIPFGVNYSEIKDSEMLSEVIYAREVFETSFTILCLANAKNSLRNAAVP